MIPNSVLDLHAAILSEIRESDHVLDVGGAMGRYHGGILAKGAELTVLDAHEPYLQLTDERAATILGDAREQLPKLHAASFDVVLAIDSIEHLTTADARVVIPHFKRIAKRVVCVFTPEGDHPQDRDPWRLGGDHWQTHRSTWYVGDLMPFGFTVTVWPTFHNEPGKSRGALWATWHA